jgi:hypothetical protein
LLAFYPKRRHLPPRPAARLAEAIDVPSMSYVGKRWHIDRIGAASGGADVIGGVGGRPGTAAHGRLRAVRLARSLVRGCPGAVARGRLRTAGRPGRWWAAARGECRRPPRVGWGPYRSQGPASGGPGNCRWAAARGECRRLLWSRCRGPGRYRWTPALTWPGTWLSAQAAVSGRLRTGWTGRLRAGWSRSGRSARGDGRPLRPGRGRRPRSPRSASGAPTRPPGCAAGHSA